MVEKVKYVPGEKQRFAELKPLESGRFEAHWRLTDTVLIGPVKLTVPPKRAVPIVFVPGIMGSNLCSLENEPVWLLNTVAGQPAGLAWDWMGKSSGYRQKLLHPGRTKVYKKGAVPKGGGHEKDSKEYHDRGWGEVSEASYHKFLLWLDEKLNSDRNPLNWNDFTHASLSGQPALVNNITRNLDSGLVMTMVGLPEMAESGRKVQPVLSDDLLKRAKAIYPVYAFGYNWLSSNSVAAKELKKRVDQIISENNIGAVKCTQVILVTHSMGGLVARACSQLPGMATKIAGIVHGVMPATGAAVAYRRCKVGMKDEDRIAGMVIGSSGKEVAAVFAQAPGALQLLPSSAYGTKWMEIKDPNGATITALPVSDPYAEIYLEKERWWGLIKNEWLSPNDGEPIIWDIFCKNVELAKDFHRNIDRRYHHNTYVFYGGGDKKGSFAKIKWTIQKGAAPSKSMTNPAANTEDIVKLDHLAIRTDGSNNLYIGGETVSRGNASSHAHSFSKLETSFWEVRCGPQDSSGDGTVPASSGRAPRFGGGPCILQQFELSSIEHEPAYRDSPFARQVTLYAITKLAAMADLT